MKVEITTVRNGYLLNIGGTAMLSAANPLGQLPMKNFEGPWFCRDHVDLMGRIAEAVHQYCDQQKQFLVD
jgi:hypothetical protein